jgi:lipopolysaccharide/colanic/teichoic acid biosynthesis glycosyltransferase
MWGLSAQEVHDAYWRSRGIQCVRRTTPFVKQPGTDMFMLMDMNQFATFELNSIAGSMVWNRSPITRVRVKTPAADYVERVVSEGDELVRISRDYTSRYIGSHGVMLTRRPSIAEAWSRNEYRHKALRELRRYVDWAKTDHYEVKGHVDYTGQDPDIDEKLVNRLVYIWENPSESISGIKQLKPGVWGVDERQLGSGSNAMVPPIWIGASHISNCSEIMVGPMSVPDDEDCFMDTDIRVCEIDEIRTPRNQISEGAVDSEADGYLVAKRVIDVMVSLVILIGLLPLIVPVSLAVSLTSGLPVFFGHERQSKGGRNFKCWKFRTMMRNAESMVVDLQEENMADGPQVFIKNDPRITRVGKILRRFHVDELPQFWNVLVGDMSLVGPRPSPENENQFCPAWRDARLSIRPGITGLWQVERTRQPGLDFQEWIKYDIEYVNRANLFLDLKIIVKTLFKIAGT